MKFSSYEYPSNKRSINKDTHNDNYKPQVKIPNYTTPVYNTSQKPQSQSPPVRKLYSESQTPISSNKRAYSPSSSPSTSRVPSNNSPVGVPMMPLYGYDNYDDAEKDWGYFRQLYPRNARQILREIDEECDKLEYDGSCMFDEYPDRNYLGRIVDRICDSVEDVIEEPLVYGKSINKPSFCSSNDEESYDSSYDLELESDDISSDNKSGYKKNFININQYRRDGGNRRNQEPRSNNWLRDFIEVLLYQEMLNRRRRYRSRRRWF